MSDSRPSADLLVRLMELEAAATKGPWHQDIQFGRVAAGDVFQALGSGMRPWPEREANCALIVAMRNALPTLLAEREHQAETIERLTEALAFYADESGWNQPPIKTVQHEILGPAYENQASKIRLDRGRIARAALTAEN